AGEHIVEEMRWFPVREPVSGNRYTVLRVKTRSGLIGWGECARAADHDVQALEKEWIGRSATLYAAIDRSSPLAGALDIALRHVPVGHSGEGGPDAGLSGAGRTNASQGARPHRFERGWIQRRRHPGAEAGVPQPGQSV